MTPDNTTTLRPVPMAPTGDLGDRAEGLVYRGSVTDGGDATLWCGPAALPAVPVAFLHPVLTPGFAWGGTGAGDADTAYAILVHAVGPGPACEVCTGAGWLADAGSTGDDLYPYDPIRHANIPADELVRCAECDGTGRTALPTGAFMREVIAAQPADGPLCLTRAEVRAWYAAHVAQYPTS